MRFRSSMTGPVPLPRNYPATMQLVYRGVRYRPAALKLFVERGGWGPEYISRRRQLSQDQQSPEQNPNPDPCPE